MFTDEQRSWVKTLLANTPAAPAAPETAAAPGAASDGAGSKDGGGDKQAFALPGLPGLPSLPGGLTDMTSTCFLDNKTGEVLTLVGKSLDLDHGKLTRNPDLIVDAGSKANWVVENSKAPSWIPIIGGQSASGCEGHIKYQLPDAQTTITCHFKATFSGNVPLLGSGNNLAEISIDGPRKGEFKVAAAGGDGSNGIYNFEIKGPGGSTPPGPQPQPGTTSKASCLVTVVNGTKVPITLAHQSNDIGDFMTNPPGTLAPGASGQFAYVHTEGGKDPGCKGSCTFEAGTPTAATWRIEWSNPVGEKNGASATLDPQTAGFASLEQAGQGDENAPFTFTLSGGGGGGGQPDVPPPPPPEDDPPFAPPPKGKQPTLRKGDKSPDGWVEYLQERLNTLGDVKMTVDGDFGAGTLKAVLAFQKAKGLQVDGTVGNQTWAALREGAAEAPSTDGRKPHSFEQKGQQARFDTERESAVYTEQDDSVMFFLTSTGDTPVSNAKVTVRVTPPGGKARVVQVPIPKGEAISGTQEGEKYFPVLQKLTASFPSVPAGAKGTEYKLEAYLDPAIGGDSWSGSPGVGAT